LNSYYAFAPLFNQCEKSNNPEIEQIFSEIKQLFESSIGITEVYNPYYQDPNFSVTGTFLENPKFEALFAKLKAHIEDLHYQQLPNFCSKLVLEAYCVEDPFGLWDKIEDKVIESLHLLEATQLAPIVYAATFRSPKKLSLDLRKQMINLMLNDLSYLNTGDKAIVLASLTNSMNVSRNRVFVKEFTSNFKSIVANSSKPADVLNYFAASVQSKLPDQLRVTRGVEATY
jgi:hypothetical protein